MGVGPAEISRCRQAGQCIRYGHDTLHRRQGRKCHGCAGRIFTSPGTCRRGGKGRVLLSGMVSRGQERREDAGNLHHPCHLQSYPELRVPKSADNLQTLTEPSVKSMRFQRRNYAGRNPLTISSSAIWTAFVAAPLRRLLRNRSLRTFSPFFKKPIRRTLRTAFSTVTCL